MSLMRTGGVRGLHATPALRPVQLNKAFQAEESPSVIYCISMQWFREWEAFVKGKDNGESSRGRTRGDLGLPVRGASPLPAGPGSGCSSLLPSPFPGDSVAQITAFS